MNDACPNSPASNLPIPTIAGTVPGLVVFKLDGVEGPPISDRHGYVISPVFISPTKAKHHGAPQNPYTKACPQKNQRQKGFHITEVTFKEFATVARRRPGPRRLIIGRPCCSRKD